MANETHVAAATAPATTVVRPRPVAVITPAVPRLAAELREAWACREVLYFLALRDIKLRYRQTFFGVGWAVLQPVATAIVFTLFFARYASVWTPVPYPLFAYAALVPWFYLSSAVGSGANSLIGASNSNLITKVYFPRILIPAAAALAWLVDLFVSGALIGGMMLYYGVGTGLSLLMVPLLLLLLVLLAVSLGAGLAAVNLRYRDVRYVLPFMLQLWLFASPIIYPAANFPRWRWLFALNPVSGIVEAFRSAVFAQPFDWGLLAASVGMTVVIAVVAWWYFWRTERTFADLV